MPKTKTKSSGLTPAQRAAYFRALQAASIELGHETPEQREEYRKTVMREECGKEHLAQLNRTYDFDACMRRFAVDSGDFETATRFAVADESRKATLIRICCAQVLQLKGCVMGTTEAADYLAGIVEQARIPCGRNVHDSSFWMDVSPDHLVTLFRILDTYRRRLLSRLLDGRTARTFKSFDASAVYEPSASGGIRVILNPGAYDSLTSIRLNIRSSAT